MKKILFSLFCLFLLVSTVDAADMTVAWKVGGMKGNPVQALLHIEIREPLRFVTPIMLPALETVFSKHTTLPIYEILKGVVENDPESIVITMNGETGLHPEIAKMAPDDMVTVFFHNPRKLKGQIPEEAFPVNILHAKKKKNFWLVTTPSAQLHVDSDISIHYRNGKGEDIFYGMVVAENGIQGVIHSSIPDVKFVSVGNSVIPWKKSTPNMLFVESVYDGKILGIFNKHITGQFSKFLKIHPFMNKNAGVGHFVIDDEAHSSYQFQFENPFNEAFSKKIEIFPLLDKIPGYRSLATPNLANGQGTKKEL